MKLKTVAKVWIASVAVITTLSVNAKPSYADDTQYYCAQLNGEWNTFLKNSSVGRVALINYNTNLLQTAGYDNLTRCKIISRKFREFHKNRQLKHFDTGIVNGYPVICAVKMTTEKCSPDNQLFQLNPGQNRHKTLQQIFNLRNGASGQPIEISFDQVYTYDEDGELSLDFEKLLKSLPESF